MRTALLTVWSAGILAVLLFSSSARADDCNSPLVAAAFRPDAVRPDCPTNSGLRLENPAVRFSRSQTTASDVTSVTLATRFRFENEWKGPTIGTSFTLWQGSYDLSRPYLIPPMVRGNFSRGFKLSLTYTW